MSHSSADFGSPPRSGATSPSPSPPSAPTAEVRSGLVQPSEVAFRTPQFGAQIFRVTQEGKSDSETDSDQSSSDKSSPVAPAANAATREIRVAPPLVIAPPPGQWTIPPATQQPPRLTSTPPAPPPAPPATRPRVRLTPRPPDSTPQPMQKQRPHRKPSPIRIPPFPPAVARSPRRRSQCHIVAPQSRSQTRARSHSQKRSQQPHRSRSARRAPQQKRTRTVVSPHSADLAAATPAVPAASIVDPTPPLTPPPPPAY